jgi:hypothetical protein
MLVSSPFLPRVEALTRLYSNSYFQLALADRVVPNIATWGFFWNFSTLHKLIDILQDNSTLQIKRSLPQARL